MFFHFGANSRGGATVTVSDDGRQVALGMRGFTQWRGRFLIADSEGGEASRGDEMRRFPEADALFGNRDDGFLIRKETDPAHGADV